jgi:endo-1,4-beta-xylanase
MQIRAADWSPALKLACAAVVAGLVGGLACGASATWLRHDPAAAEAAKAQPAVKPVEGLGGGLDQLGVRPAVQIGTAVRSEALQDDPQYRGVLTQEFSSLTPENALKWDILEPARGQYNWANADALVNFAQANHQSVRGHTLVWYYALPGWLTTGTFTPQQFSDLLEAHIKTVVGRYKGRIKAWDVINEPLADNGQLRPSIWMRALGPGYIADALRWAHEADPDAKLYINDFNVETVNPKSTALYNVVAGLKRDGVPLDGVGIQAHLALTSTLNTLDANLRRFADLGLDVAITELDVRINKAAPTQLNTQATLYAQVLRSCLGVRRCVSYTVWGFSDKYSWIPLAYPGWGNACMFDAVFHPKAAYGELRQVLSTAAKR